MLSDSGVHGVGEDAPPSYETALNCESLSNSDNHQSHGTANYANIDGQWTTGHETSPHENITSYARALHVFQGEFANELSFKPNEIIYLIRHIDNDW